MIRPATEADAPAICAIYNPFVAESTITFEEDPVSPPEMARRIGEITTSLPWLVAEEDGQILGYAYASPWNPRSAYRFTVQCTVYTAPGRPRRGLGTALYEALFAELRRRGIHSVIGLIALPNDASIALHEKLGFVKVAHLKDVGWKFGRWVDVGNWQLVL